MIDHVDYLARLVGPEHVGIGLDYIEAFKERGTILPESVVWRTRRADIFGTVHDFGNQSYPIGLESIRKLPNLTQKLIDRGYSDGQISGILGGNWLRTFERVVG